MNYYPTLVAEAAESERSVFYKQTYLHVAGAVLAFILVEALLLKFLPEEIILAMVGTKFVWLFIIGAFWLLSMLTNKLAFSADRSTQYMGLGLYVVLEAIIFLPMIFIAYAVAGGAILQQAAVITLAMFAGLTAMVFMTNKDFSFLRSALVIGGFVSLGLVVAGAMFGFNLGLWFSVAMVVLASGSIIYQTSQLKYHYQTDQYVGAALQLFAAVMLLFWYVLRILLRFANRD